MASLPEPIEALIAGLGRLPGIGPRSAERIALHIVQSDAAAVRDLARLLIDARTQISECSNCGALTVKDPCPICSDPKRNPSLVCIVERPVDVLSIDKSGSYHGLYHVLGGKISPINGVGPEDLRVAQLELRLTKGVIQEAILALPSDVEGDATSFFLAKLLTARGIKATRIAQGLPVGSGLEFADELTLSRAIEGRRAVQDV